MFILGIDLALENTGLALVHDGQLLYSSSFSVKLAKKGGEDRYIARVQAWLLAARQQIEQCIEITGGSEILVVYENRPFLLAKHRKGEQSAAAVLSYGEALALLRVVLAEKHLLNVVAVPPVRWQNSILDGLAISNAAIDEAEKRFPQGTKRIKLMVAAAVHRRTGIWPATDHASDAAAIALAAMDLNQNNERESK